METNRAKRPESSPRKVCISGSANSRCVPIDQGMLDRADYPIAIPDPDGVVHITAGGKNGRCAARAGAIGWADEVSAVLGELAESD